MLRRKRSPSTELPAAKRKSPPFNVPNKNRPKLTKDDYTVAWICALPVELAAAQAMLDEMHADLPSEQKDSNSYSLGRMGEHNIVIACLPAGSMGTSAAAAAAKDLLRSFHKIRFGLMVGIGGGAPSAPNHNPNKDIRLGDVVVSYPGSNHGGVIQYDFGKTVKEGKFIQTGTLDKPPAVLRASVAKLMAKHKWDDSAIGFHIESMVESKPKMADEFEYQGEEHDRLFAVDYDHIDDNPACEKCDRGRILTRKPRRSTDPVIHYGLIGSANQVMKHGGTREKLRQEKGIICFEMEAAGLMDNFPCIVVRGICDYSDSHKNDLWQAYAAATATGYAKELLESIPPEEVILTEEAGKIVNMMRAELAPIHNKLDPLLDDRTREERNKILNWLAPQSYEEQYATAFRKRQEGTGQWFLDSPSFTAWARGDIPILLCPGIPGAGKTILASTVVKHLESVQNKQEYNVAFLFCAYGRQEEQSPDDLLAMLLRQLAEQCVLMPESVQALYNSHSQRHTRPSVEELRRALNDLGQRTRTFVVIDALDECLEETRTILLHEIQHSLQATGMSFMITTRPNHELDRRFADQPRLEIRANETDIMDYVGNQLKTFPQCVRENENLQASIKRLITEAADGMFLLASFYIECLKQQRTEGEVEDALHSFQRGEQGLQKVYKVALERIEGHSDNDRKWAHRVLCWVIHAKRPLTPVELQYAIAISPGSGELQKKYLPPIGEILSLCAGLISFNEESKSVDLVHHTARQYFMTTADLPDWIRRAPLEISRTCLTYLSFEVFKTGYALNDEQFERRISENPFLDYAARYWGYHAQSFECEIVTMASNVLQNDPLTKCAGQAMLTEVRYREDGYSQRTPQLTGLHLAAWFGLELLLDDLLCNSRQNLSTDVNVRDSYHRTPLSLAASRGHKKTVELLIRYNPDINARDRDDRTALHTASDRGYEEVVHVLLQHRADTTIRDRWGWTALHLASGNGNEKVAQELVQHNPDISATDSGGRTALHRAADKGHVKVVALLRADATVQDNKGYTALHAAAANGYEEAVKLLERASSIKCKSGWTAFHKAAMNGHTRVVKVLLESGADVDAKDNDGRTPLHRAAEKAKTDVVEILLKLDLDLSMKDKWGMTVLHTAATNGHEKVVSLLLDRDVDIQARTKGGWMAIHEAASNGHTEVVKLLLNSKAGIDAKTDSNLTALHVAATGGHDETVQFLLEHQASVNMTDASGRAPIHEAAFNGYEEVVLLLLEHGADCNVSDDDGQTAINDAESQEHEEVAKILKGRNPLE